MQLDPAYSYKDAKGQVYNTSVALEPFTSIVLIQVPYQSTTNFSARHADTASTQNESQVTAGTITPNNIAFGGGGENVGRANARYAFKGAKTVPYPPLAEQVLVAPELFISAYPVPFSHSTTLQVLADQPGQVSLNVYDAQGKLVKHVFSGVLTAERRNFTLSSAGLTDGIYFVRLQSIAGSVTKEISLIR